MNENDKILINAYLDGEASSEEELYVESLLESSIDANEYANKIKDTNNELDAFFKKDYSEISNKISLFIDKDLKKTTPNKLQYFVFNKYFRNYALSATIFFAIGISFNQILQNQDYRLDFEDSTIELELYKTRSSNSQIKDQFKNILVAMVNEKKLKGILGYDKKKYELTIIRKNLIQNSQICYQGKVLSSNFYEDFIFCISETDNSLIFIKD